MTANDVILPRASEVSGTQRLDRARDGSGVESNGFERTVAAKPWPARIGAERMAALGKLLRTTTFRLTLVYLTVFALFAAFLLGYFAWNTRRLITEQITETVDAELQGLTEQYRQGGIRRLVFAIEGRARRPGSRVCRAPGGSARFDSAHRPARKRSHSARCRGTPPTAGLQTRAALHGSSGTRPMRQASPAHRSARPPARGELLLPSNDGRRATPPR